MRVQVGDIRLFFDIEGAKLVPEGPVMRERPTVILLHGGPGLDHTEFWPFGSTIADIAQVIYLDHRGNGRSDRSGPERWNLEVWADDLRAFCDALEIQRPVVLGSSFGGMVAQTYAAKYPEHPAKLILTNTMSRLRLDRMFPLFERLGGARAAEVARRFFADPMPNFLDYIQTCLPLYSQSPPVEGALDRVVINMEVGAYFVGGEMQTFDTKAALARVRCPTLVLSGGLDPVATTADVEELAAALPASLVRAHHFPASGHAVLTDARDEALAAVRAFLTTP